jgi:hypothetical protein
MKTLISVIISMSVMLSFKCSKEMKSIESEYTIKVSGSKGLEFDGNYAIGMEKPVTVDGIVPIEYKGKGLSAFCMFRNTSSSGFLKVEILKGASNVSASETKAPYGVITLGENPLLNL